MGVGPGPRLPNTVGGWAIWLVVVIAILANVYVAATALGVVIPPWILHIVWICIAVVIVVAAIRFVSGQ